MSNSCQIPNQRCKIRFFFFSFIKFTFVWHNDLCMLVLLLQEEIDNADKMQQRQDSIMNRQSHNDNLPGSDLQRLTRAQSASVKDRAISKQDSTQSGNSSSSGQSSKHNSNKIYIDLNYFTCTYMGWMMDFESVKDRAISKQDSTQSGNSSSSGQFTNHSSTTKN